MSKLENFLFNALASKWPNDRFEDRQNPPLTEETLRLHGRLSDDPRDDTVVRLGNDAFEVWIGYPDRWLYHTTRKEFHKIIRWYLWLWAYGEWFGLRRVLYYKLLHRRVNRMTNRKAL